MQTLFNCSLIIFFLGLAGCSSEVPKPQTQLQPPSLRCFVTKQTNDNGNYTEYTYNGDLLIKTESKSSSDYVFSSTEYQYTGTKRTKVLQFDNKTGVSILTYLFTYEYDGNNLVKTQISNYDQTGKLTSQGTNIYEFDANGNLIKELYTSHYIDHIQGPLIALETMITYEYKGKLVIRKNRFSKNRTTNQFIASSSNTFEYDANGNVVEDKYYDGTGQFTYSYKNTYSSTNKLLKVIIEYNDGRSFLFALYEYDEKDKQVLAISFGENGKKYSEYRTTNQYGSNGNILKSVVVNNNYYNSNTGQYVTAPFTSIVNTYTYEYLCMK